MQTLSRVDSSRTRSLLLVGHGSHLSPESSAPICELAERIRARALFDEVVEAFWKEEPSLRDAIDLCSGDDVFIVPVFLAEGYFTRTVLPRELGLDGASTLRHGRIIRYCPPLGAHPAMAGMVLERAHAVLPTLEARSRAALVVIGHGTDRSPDSGGTVHRLVSELRRTSGFARVDCGFLDEEPRIRDVVDRIEERDVVLVPFFIAEGWHTTDTIPGELGLDGPVSRSGNRTLRYTPPVGTHPAMVDVCLAATRDAAAQAYPVADPPARASIVVAREAFLAWLAGSPDAALRFLQIEIRRLPAGSFLLAHVDDHGQPAGRLRKLAGPLDLRAIARFDPGGAYRPLRTTADLATGWELGPVTADGVWAAVSILYPAAVLHWHRFATERPAPVHFPIWAARQTGIYSGLQALPSEEVERVAASCCTRCLRFRRWEAAAPAVPLASSPIRPSGHHSPGGPIVPCDEPCTVFASAVREATARSATREAPETPNDSARSAVHSSAA